jgi:energy-converting hydrogenase Eha subunit H
MEKILRGLKPVRFVGLIGTTKVVPFYKANLDTVCRSADRFCLVK